MGKNRNNFSSSLCHSDGKAKLISFVKSLPNENSISMLDIIMGSGTVYPAKNPFYLPNRQDGAEHNLSSKRYANKFTFRLNERGYKAGK